MKQVKIDDELYEHVVKHGKYNERFTDVLRRLLKLERLSDK